jgi:hypothetical protein
MAAPNLQTPTTINGKTTFLALSSTNETAFLSNAASSGKLQTVHALTISNNSSAGAADVTVRIYNAASGGTAFVLGPITVPVGQSVIPIGAENKLNLEEDRRITIQASAANYLTAIASYDEVS